MILPRCGCSRAGVCHEGLHHGVAVALYVSQADVQDAIAIFKCWVRSLASPLRFQFGFAPRPRLCVFRVFDYCAGVRHECLHRGIAVALCVSQPDVQDATAMLKRWVRSLAPPLRFAPRPRLCVLQVLCVYFCFAVMYHMMVSV